MLAWAVAPTRPCIKLHVRVCGLVSLPIAFLDGRCGIVWCFVVQQSCVRAVAQLVAYPASHADLGAPPMLSKLVKLLQSSNEAIASDVPMVCVLSQCL